MEADDIDTDQIIPAQFLKVTERKGLGRYLFYRWRYDDSGRLTGAFVLDRKEFSGAKILVAGRNFGIGSSRENAVWALLDIGIRSVLASSFGDIFYNNASRNGLLCVRLPDRELGEIRRMSSGGDLELSVDLEKQTVSHGAQVLPFEVEPYIKQRLMAGADDIAVTSANYAAAIERYERSMPRYLKPRPSRPE